MNSPLKLALLAVFFALVVAITPCVLKQFLAPPAIVAALKEGPGSLPAPVSSPVAVNDRVRSAVPQPLASRIQPVQVPVADHPTPQAVVLSAGAPAADALPSSSTMVAAVIPKPELPYRPEVADAQQLLRKIGIAVGAVDGRLGQRTEAALKAFQEKHGLSADGQPSRDTISRLQAEAARLNAPTPAATPATPSLQITAATPSPIPVVTTPQVAATPAPQIAAVATQELSKAMPVSTPAVHDIVLPPHPTPAAPAEKPEGQDNKPQSETRTAQAELRLDAAHVPSIHRVSGVKQIQQALGAASLYSEPPDGKWGHKTIEAVSAFQKERGLAVTGKLDDKTWKQLCTVAASPDGQTRITEAASTTRAVGSVAEPPSKEIASSDGGGNGRLLGSAVLSADGSGVAASGTEAQANLSARASDGEEIGVARPRVDAAAAGVKVSVPREDRDKSVAAQPASGGQANPESAAPSHKREVVVRVNADAGMPGNVALATPSAVSESFKKNAGSKSPSRSSAVAQAIQKQRQSLEKELEEARVRVRTIASDSRYEIGKYAPKVLDPVNDLITKTQRALENNEGDAVELRKQISEALRGLDEAKKQSLARKAEEKVNEVESSYKAVKSRFSEEVKSGSLAETMGKIDSGFKAMQEDFKKANYDPIVELCDGFKLQIELLQKDAAKRYVDRRLASKSVKSKLSKSATAEVKSLLSQKKYVEAADLLDRSIKPHRRSAKRGA